jgi:hypothetical protein
MITATDASPTPTPTPTPVPCGGTRVEDDDGHITYSNGWHLISNSSASSGHFRMNEGGNNQHNVSLTFDTSPTANGTITYFYATSPKGGSANIVVDGVSQGTINYNGSSGSNKAPVFGSSRSVPFGPNAGGHHTVEIRPINGAVFIDGFCLGTATPTGAPGTGPGTTTQSTATESSGQTLLSNLSLPSGTRAISIAVESNLKVPIQLVLVDPSGRIVQTVNSSSGLAILEAPLSQGGTYVFKTINLSLGPVQVWSVATPLVAR